MGRSVFSLWESTSRWINTYHGFSVIRSICQFVFEVAGPIGKELQNVSVAMCVRIASLRLDQTSGILLAKFFRLGTTLSRILLYA